MPPPEWTVSQWADAERVLSSEASAEPGQWNTDRAPYQRGLMDALSDPFIETVVVMKSAQVGYSEILNNIIGFYIAQDPAPIMMILPTLELAESFSKTRISTMLRDTPCLAGKVRDARTRDSANTVLEKSYPGGTLVLAGANSPASLASRPMRIVLFDEVDRYPKSAGTEGDPISLGKKRTVTFWNRKILIGGTPTVKGESRTELAFNQTDKRYYHLPCPDCGQMQPLQWARIDFETARHACVECGSLNNKIRWLRGKGEWIATEPNPPDPKARGFHICELYSPWVPWETTIENFKAAKGNPELLKAWVNLSLGETWEEAGETVDPTGLLSRCEQYRAPVPAGALALTCGVDVQRDRLELEVVGWGPGEESWSVARQVLWGDPDRPDVWEDLDEVLGQTWMHEHGHQLQIMCTCIDSGGSNTQAVYDYCRNKTSRKIFAIKGQGGDGIPVVSSPSQRKVGKERRKVQLIMVGVDAAKSTIYGRLQIAAPGPGYCHFSTVHNDVEYFAQLTAETQRTKYHRGFPRREWSNTRANGRNESLDCRVYAYAGLKISQPHWKRLERQLAPVVRMEPEPLVLVAEPAVDPAAAPQPVPQPVPQPMDEALAPPEPAKEIRLMEPPRPARQSAPMAKPRKRSGGFVQGWR